MPKTYNDLYLATRTALKNAGVEAYALEARLLVAYAVGKTTLMPLLALDTIRPIFFPAISLPY